MRILIYVFFVFASCAPAKHYNVLADEEMSEGWILLFDGKSTDLWRGYNQTTFPKQGWEINKDGVLVVNPGGKKENITAGNIITKQVFENFHLKVDFKVSQKGNSGIFYRVKEKDQPIWFSAPEYQILDPAYFSGNKEKGRKHLSGDNYDMHASATDFSKPAGEWNTAEIIINNNHVEHRLNGQKTVEYTIESPDWYTLWKGSKFANYPDYGRTTFGYIGLQDHGNEIHFKNIKIKELPSSYHPIYNGNDLSGWKIYGTEKWYVENGDLVCESGPEKAYGYLATKESYDDFDLSLEFKQESNGNSGVFFRSNIEGTRISGWQAEVAPPGLHTGGVYESYGRGWLIKPEKGLDQSLKMGEWNTLRVLAKGNKVTTWLNGQQMIHLQDDKIGKANGKLALQIHDGGGIKVRWRNLKVKKI